MLPTPCVMLSRDLPAMAGYCLVWQHYGTLAPGDHQELLVHDYFQYHFDCLSQPGNAPLAPGVKGKKLLNIGDLPAMARR